MIKYALNCCNGHRFESWFASAAGFDDQAAQEFIVCPTCQSHDVSKAIMAPALLTGVEKRPAEPVAVDRVADAGRDDATHGDAGQDDRGHDDRGQGEPVHDEAAQARAMIRTLHRYVRETSENVGDHFAEEARKIAEGDAPQRPIHGAASLEEASALLREGIRVLPLPPLPDELN